jgi:methyltransferase (TIGR00027 family)
MTTAMPPSPTSPPGPDRDEPIRDVSDTALWVAVYRAQESERKDALFQDPYARRLAGERGQRIVDSIPRGRAWGWPMVVRTCVMDEIVLRAVRDEGFDTVLNLAAGLDARPWRLELPPELSWIDVDMPGMLAYKARGLAGETPRCRYTAHAADLRVPDARRAVFAEAGATAKRALVVTEGLLIYLEPQEVGALADDLAREPSFARWLLDIASPALIEMMARRFRGPSGITNAPFRFAPAEGTAFFEPHGWRERTFRSTMAEGYRLHRTFPFAWVWRLLMPFMPAARRRAFERFSGCVVLERSAR